MKNYLIVTLGAGVGGALRYFVTDLASKIFSITFPFGTLSVNVIGSFILGFVLFYLDSIELISADLRLFLTIGLCGGFTTFSTFSFETMKLIQDSEYLLAGANVLLNVVLTIFAVYLASVLSKLFIGG